MRAAICSTSPPQLLIEEADDEAPEFAQRSRAQVDLGHMLARVGELWSTLGKALAQIGQRPKLAARAFGGAHGPSRVIALSAGSGVDLGPCAPTLLRTRGCRREPQQPLSISIL